MASMKIHTTTLAVLALIAGSVLGQEAAFVPFDPAKTCNTQWRPAIDGTNGTGPQDCWQPLDGRPGCYVYRSQQDGNTATWTGACNGSVPDGKGTLTWLFEGQIPSWLVDDHPLGEGVWGIEQGTFDNGSRTGRWVVRYGSGSYGEFPYVNGNRHGVLIYRSADSNDVPAWRLPDCPEDTVGPGCRTGFETRYVNGERQQDP